MEKLSVEKPKSILWVDNQINELFGPILNEIKLRGHDLLSFDNGEDAVKAISRKKIDLALVDLLMPGMKGAEVIEQLKSEQPDAKAATVSSYQSFRGIAVSDSLTARIEKPELLSAMDDPSEACDYLFEEIDRQSNEFLEDSIKCDFVEVSIEQYRAMEMDDRHALLQVAKSELRDEIQRVFGEGAAWVLFCGSRAPSKFSTDLRDVPTSGAMLKIGDEMGFAPLLFVAPIQIDDVAWSNGCSYALEGYPTVTFKLKEREETCHFDTGSPTSWVKKDWFDEVFPEKRQNQTGLIDVQINGQEVAVYKEIIHPVFVDQDEGHVTEGVISFFVVVDWSSFPLRRQCNTPCPKNLGDCEYRFGLIGRDISSNDPIVLNLTTKTTTIIQKWQTTAKR